MKNIKIDTEFIKLQQMIKLANIVGQGSDAKWLIRDGLVKVNGRICTERGRKLRDKDVVEVENNGEFQITSSVMGE